MHSQEEFHWCCYGGAKQIDNHWLLWGRPRSRFPLQGMVGPDWRLAAWTFSCIPIATAGWACLMILGAPRDGGGLIRTSIVLVGVAIALIGMILYLCTACTDPGIVFKHMARPASVPAPTGAGTPVRTDEPGNAARRVPAEGRGPGGATVSAATERGGERGAGPGTNTDVGDVEVGLAPAQGHKPVPPIGLPAAECEAAVGEGSGAVVDMRNAPPVMSPMWSHVAGAVPSFSATGPSPQVPIGQDITRVTTGESQTVCGRCQIYRPPRAFHCTSCNVCVDRLDHHCPFMGQCVGRKTLPSFYMFVVVIWILVCYVGIAVAYLVVAVVVHGL